MTTKPVIKENFIEFLKINYPECFESGTPITENAFPLRIPPARPEKFIKK